MKLGTKIFVLGLVAYMFIAFDVFLYTNVTTKYMSDASQTFKAKSIELDEYLPFEENTKDVLVKTDLKLKKDLPVIDGAAALYPVFSSMVGSIYPKKSVDFDGNDFTEKSKLRMNNTRDAYKEVVDGDVDLIFCAAASQEQKDYAKEKGVKLKFVPIGKEAFVFFVNNQNPVNNLTSQQIRDIYSCKIKNWKEVGGENERITPLLRNKGSGSQTTMDKFMNGQPYGLDIDAMFGKSIAFSFRYYVSELTHYGGIKMLNVDGIKPSIENIKDNSYPLTSEFYCVYRKDNKNENIPIIVDWLLSKEGQKLIEKNGYVSIE